MKKIGTSLALMAGLLLVAGVIINPIFFDGFTVDPIAIYLLWAGIKFRKGERTNVKWPAIWSGWYCLVISACLITTFVSPDTLNIGKYSLSSSIWLRCLAVVEFFIFLIWNALNLTILLMIKKKIAEPGHGAEWH